MTTKSERSNIVKDEIIRLNESKINKQIMEVLYQLYYKGKIPCYELKEKVFLDDNITENEFDQFHKELKYLRDNDIISYDDKSYDRKSEITEYSLTIFGLKIIKKEKELRRIYGSDYLDILKEMK